MPRLPDVNSPLPIPQGSRNVQNVPVYKSGLSDVGDFLVGFGEKKEADQEQFEAARAKSYLLQESLRLETEFEQDNDYATYVDRYTEKMGKVREDALSMIRDNRTRDFLDLDIQDTIARGQNAMSSKALSREREAGAAILSETLGKNADAYLRATDEKTRASILEATQGLLYSGQARGFVDDAKGRSRKFAEDLMLDRAAMLPPDKQLALFKPSEVLEDGQPVFEKTGTWVDMVPVDKRMRLYSQAGAAVEAAARRGEEVDILAQLENQKSYMDLVMDDSVSNDEKLVKINEADLRGEIADWFATEARRYLNSTKEVSAAATADAMADVVTRMYDLNAIADMDQKDYLRGVNNLREEIMTRAANGEITASDEKKLDNQIKSLMSQKVSEATQDIAYSFKDANEIIQKNLPPEYRGVAIRQLFYSTQGQEMDANAYKSVAAEIVDKIKTDRHISAQKKVDAIIKNYEFSSVEEAEKADLPSGTIVVIGGRKARIK